MIIKYSKKDIETLIVNYYEKFLGAQNPKVKIRTNKESVGYGMGEHEGTVTEIKVTSEKIIAGIAKNIESIITKSDLENMINEMIKSDGYSVEGLSFDSGLSYSTVGYGMQERDVSKPYFKGINVNVKEVKEIESNGRTL